MTEIDTRIILSASWIALMLTYLLGDVLRIFSGDFVAGEMNGQKVAKSMYLVAALIMLIPIIMLLLALTLPYDINRWANIIAAVSLFLFNLVALPTYKSAYDKFLIVVGLVFNVFTVWTAWNWAGLV